MRGPKLNEGATAVGERHGTRATAKYVRSSAYKARVVLDLVRGLDVKRADEVLQFTDRSIAHDIRKVLASAVANATDADSAAFIADADELFVLACFADEGPTLRRFRPRARGRATRIRKRSCHITIVLARMSEDRIEVIQARAEGSGGGASANRAARVERSRKRAARAKAEIDAIDAEETVDDADGAAEDTTEAVQSFSGVETAEEVSTNDESSEASSVSEAEVGPDDQEASAGDEPDDASSASSAETGFAPSQWSGSLLPDVDGKGPDSHPIKGNAESMLYHTPDSRYYEITKAEVWFDTEDNAQAAGFSKPGAQKDED